MLNFKPLELSELARQLLARLYQDEEKALQAGHKAIMMTMQPQQELQELRTCGYVNRSFEELPIGQVYCYSISEEGRRYIKKQLQ